jgi:hypothetical protein
MFHLGAEMGNKAKQGRRYSVSLLAAVLALLITVPLTASASPNGYTEVYAGYTDNGILGLWTANFRGSMQTNGGGHFSVSGTLTARCPLGVINGFGKVGFHNGKSSHWQTYDVSCSSGDTKTVKVNASESGALGDTVGFTVCMGGAAVRTECGGERTYTLN